MKYIKLFESFNKSEIQNIINLLKSGDESNINLATKLCRDNPKLEEIEEVDNLFRIIDICDEYRITDYTINDDGAIDVDNDVNLNFTGLYEIPLKFNIVHGEFSCINNRLTSLIGCPVKVYGSFDCSENELETLEGCPSEIHGGFDCSENELTSLIGCPTKIDGDFNCHSNLLASLNGCPKEIGGSFHLDYNDLTTLDHFPKSVGGDIDLDGNRVEIIYKLFPNSKSFMDSLDYDYFRGGNRLNKIRLTQALKEFGLEFPENIKGYIWE